MSTSLDQKNKVILDPTDSTALMDYFSRLNPGDDVSGSFKATLDEAGQKSVVLSIVEVEIANAGDIKLTMAEKGDDDANGGGADGESAAIKVMRNQQGVPENEDNLPPDSMPTH